MNIEIRLKKAHIKLLSHPETCLYAGVVLHGKSTIVDDVPTACTNGIDVRYGEEFMSKLTDQEVTGVVMHENLHKALRHLMRYKKLMKDDAMLANAAMDYVVNSIIFGLKDKTLATLPKGALYNKKFENWSVLEVYNFLKTGNPPNQPSSGSKGDGEGVKRDGDKVTVNSEEFGLKGHDEHDGEDIQEMTPEQSKQYEQAIEEALRQGSMLAGRFGTKMPRAISESLVKPIDWREVLRDFVSQACIGRDDYTFRKFNKKRLADDYFLPGVESEEMNELVVAIDTSGSISSQDLSEVASHIADVCNTVKPGKVRVLWWDTEVHGEQVFLQHETNNIRKLLKPQGGGGTRVSSVRDYIVEKRIKTDCVIVFTDGWVESDINWTGVQSPTLWLVKGNSRFNPPAGGRMVNKE